MIDLTNLPEPTDGELWRRAAKGDGDAFGVIFDRHCESVRSYCARRTGSIEAADDLLSIVFLEAWRRRDQVELVDDQALPWLYGVARRTIQQRWRTSIRHRRALARLPAAAAVEDHADLVAGRIDDQRRLDALKQAVDRLRPIDRDVLMLCVWQGLDYASASVALGVPIGTVRSRLARARVRLEELSNHAPDPGAFHATPVPSPVEESR